MYWMVPTVPGIKSFSRFEIDVGFESRIVWLSVVEHLSVVEELLGKPDRLRQKRPAHIRDRSRHLFPQNVTR